MPLPATESLHPEARGIDAVPAAEALRRLHAGQQAALAAAAGALPALEAASALMAETLASGGRLVYAAAGSSALMAMADALELPGTFGIAPERILILMAGGLPVDARMPGDTEDDAEAARRDAEAIRPGDLVLALTASGSTPYPRAVAQAARAKGARTICLANNPGAAIFAEADLAVCLPTPPELIAGSTRMGAGTAQKAALNMLSTLTAIRLGLVHDGMMVALVADNRKLRARAARMVADISGAGPAAAEAALDAARGAVKPAALIAAGAAPEEAARLLEDTRGNLRRALARLETDANHNHTTNGRRP